MRAQRRLRFISSLLLVALFSACGGQEADDGRTTVVFWHSFVQSTVPALEKLIDRFETEHPGIRIDAQYVPTGEALVQKLVTAVRANSAPDISWIHSHFLEELVEADAVYPMSHFIDGPDGLPDSVMADIYPALIQYGSWRGTLYSMPMEATNLGLVYNKDHFREVGLDPEHPPANWDELRDFAMKLTVDNDGDGEPDRVGFMAPAVPADGPQGTYMTWQWTPFLWQAGGYYITEDQRRVLFHEEPGIEALTLWKELYERQNLKWFTNDWITAFASRQTSMIMDGPWNLPRYPSLLKDIDWGIAMLPAGPVKRATVVAGEYLAIFKQSEHPDAAWTFVKWIIDPQVQAFWSMESGYLPVLQSVLEVDEYAAFLEGNQGQKAFVEQMAYAQAQRPVDYHTLEIQRNLTIAIERATVGGEDPATVLREAGEASNALLAEVDFENADSGAETE
jgi:multiple sugar transport system substrate-binding protein